ncbi:MAG: hypothetical protein ACXVJT_07435 [Thermoanaerobaculia bacterium]
MLVDNLNPTNQFHPYQAPDAIPHAERGSGLKNVGARRLIDNARAYARKNPALVLGGIAAAVMGAGLLRARR